MTPFWDNTYVWSYTNVGYFDLTFNLIESWRRKGLVKHMNVFVQSEQLLNFKSHALFKDDFTVVTHNHLLNKQNARYDSKDFKNVTRVKINLLHDILAAGMNSLYMDSDTVIIKDPRKYLQPLLDGHDGLFQADGTS